MQDGWQLHAFAGGGVLASPASDELLLLNANGARIWREHRAGRTAGEIAANLVRDFDVMPEVALGDVRQQIRAWEGQLIQRPLHRAKRRVRAPAPVPVHGSTRIYRLGPASIAIGYAEDLLLATFHPLYAHLEAATGTPPARHLRLWRDTAGFRLAEGAVELCRESELEAFTEEVVSAIQVIAAETANPAMVIHGAAVARDGACVLLPGASGSGKSTLAAALACSGFTLLGDDLLLVERSSMRVWGVPACLNLKQGSLEVLQAQYGLRGFLPRGGARRPQLHFLPPPSFDPAVLHRPYRVVGTVFPGYRAGGDVTLQQIDPPRMLAGMLRSNSTISPDIRGEPLAELLAWLEKLESYTLSYGDLKSAVVALERIFAETG